ncbi:MAG: hypothetical protein ACLVJH_05225 [Faecalibacterium prausnitzii]
MKWNTDSSAARLGHLYSKTIHELLCGYSYELCPLPTEADARAFLQRRQFKAINVTIPYKKLVMEYCSFIDPRATRHRRGEHGGQ